MEKTWQLVDFISVSGNKVKQTVAQEGNMYRWLVTQGFGRAIIGTKIMTFRRWNAKIRSSSFRDMEDAFEELLEKEGNANLLEWFIHKSPLKQNNLYRHYLKSELTEAEVHQLKMQNDATYRHNYKIDQVLVMLTEHGFKQTVDEKGTIGKGQILYYCEVSDDRYLIFSHHNFRHKNLVDGFDVWLAGFRNEKQIGQIQSGSLKDLRLSFSLDRDYPLVEPYLINTLQV